MTDFAHIHPDFRHVMLLSDKERLDFLHQPRWIDYGVATHLRETLAQLMERPIRPRMPNLLIVGDSNNGKTSFIRHFYQRYGSEFITADGDPIKPIVLAEAPTKADEKGLYAQILEKLFVAYRLTDPANKLRYQIIHLFRACQVRMLIIDEFNSLVTGTMIKQREVMNALKNLCNELCIPIVGIGTRDAVRVLHTDPQHASRFDVATLPLWELNAEFQRLLARFEGVLPLKNASKLHCAELAQSLHAISGGNLGDLHRLLIECASEAIRSNKEQIDKSIIEHKAWVRPTRGYRELVG